MKVTVATAMYEINPLEFVFGSRGIHYHMSPVSDAGIDVRSAKYYGVFHGANHGQCAIVNYLQISLRTCEHNGDTRHYLYGGVTANIHCFINNVIYIKSQILPYLVVTYIATDLNWLTIENSKRSVAEYSCERSIVIDNQGTRIGGVTIIPSKKIISIRGDGS